MRRRTRFISGLIVLVTLALSLVEGAWAATCAPGMEMNAEVAMVDGSTPDVAPDHDCMPGHEHGEPEPGDDGAHCPFGPAGMSQGCAAAASLPASTVTMTPPSPEDADVVQMVETSPHLLRAAAIFHPPKA